MARAWRTLCGLAISLFAYALVAAVASTSHILNMSNSADALFTVVSKLAKEGEGKVACIAQGAESGSSLGACRDHFQARADTRQASRGVSFRLHRMSNITEDALYP